MRAFSSFLQATSLALGVAMAPGAHAADFVQCLLENNKILTLSHLETVPTYQYGTAKKPEITLSPNVPTVEVYKGSVMFAAGEASYIRFVNGAYSYVFYDGEGRGWHFTGLLVYKGKDVIAQRACKQTPSNYSFKVNEINALEDPEHETFAYLP